MKLLFDENLSPRLPKLLSVEFPGSAHVLHSGLGGKSDALIIGKALSEGFVIATKDEDYPSLCDRFGALPKIIWLKIPNCSTGDSLALLSRCSNIVKPSARIRTERS